MSGDHFARALVGRVASFMAGALALVAVSNLGACHTPREGTDKPSEGTAGPNDGQGPASGVPYSRPGVAHTSNIDMVAISSDGAAALSRDQIGGTRLWPALDGSREPLPIPVQGPQQFSVQPRGDGFTVAVVDSAGGAKIFDVDEQGEVAELGALAPFQPLFGIYVLPGGERALALFRDHSIRLVDRTAQELFRFEESRFRPTSLRLGADGKRFVALTRGNGNEFEVQSMRVVEDDGGEGPRLRLHGAARPATPSQVATETTAVLSPDATRFVVVDRPTNNEWELAVIDLAEKVEAKKVTVRVPAHVVPNLGFVSNDHLLVSTAEGSLSWLVDLDDGSNHPRASAPQDFVTQGRAQAVGAGIQAAAHGSWLYVHDVDDRSHRYLGYRDFQTQSVGISPKGQWVAWAYMSGPIFVEGLGDNEGERFEINSEPGVGTLKVRFLDEEHLVSISNMGGILLHRWRDGTHVDAAGIQGGIRALHFEPSLGVMLIERHNNDARLFEVSTEGFAGPYIVADQAFRSGLLAEGTKRHPEAIMWTLDSANKLRHYGLEELRGDPSQTDVMAKGDAILPGKVAPLAIDRDGRHYGVRWNGSTMELFVDADGEVKTKVAASGDISGIVPSPSGKAFLAIHQRGQSTSLSAHDSTSLEERWSFSTGVFHNELVWSPDDRFVAVAASTGAVVLDAETGKPVHRRCGIEFVALGAAPATAFNGLNLKSMCEQ
ncbi:MAG: hypothetical protein AAF799_12140 [Myxococcota bacterium]